MSRMLGAAIGAASAIASRLAEEQQKTLTAAAKSSALDVQEGGGHYKTMAIQPVEFIHKNGIGFIEGSVIKYVSRWRSKGGVEDLRKARHFIDLLIELENDRAGHA